jgi:hypothetical protein
MLAERGVKVVLGMRVLHQLEALPLQRQRRTLR